MKSRTSHIRTIIHGFSYLYRIEKAYTLLHLATSILEPLKLYIPISMTAMILNELVGQRELRKLLFYASITIGLQFVFTLLLAGLNQLKGFHLNQFFKSEKMLFAEKSMAMDFDKIEDSEIHALLERVRGESQNGYNMFFLNMFSGELIRGLSSMLTAAILSIPLIVAPGIHVSMKLLILIALVTVVLVNYFMTQKSNDLDNAMFERFIPFNALFNFYNDYYESYQAGKDIRLYDMGEYVAQIQRQQNRVSTDILWESKKKMLKYVVIRHVVSGILNLAVYAFVIQASLVGRIAIGDIMKYVSYMALFVTASSGIFSHFQSLFNNNKYLVNYFKYLEIPSRHLEGQIKNVDITSSPVIEFRDVSFRYPHSETEVLKDLSFKIYPHERIAIVGRNGSGKTTMIKLLCRLYTPTQGRIYLYGKDIQTYDYPTYLQRLSVVFQDFKIFAFPLGQNIAASEDVNETKAMEAIDKAGLTTLLSRHPMGLEAPLYKDFDEDGLELSGGEAQKVAFARALYRDAPIMILDEPTAALDPIAENEIYTKFDAVTKDKTVLFISHRLAACTFSDRIFVFDHGTIIQDGCHQELLKEVDGRYYEFWEAQAKYYREGSSR